MSRRNFDSILIESILQGMNKTIGESGTTAVLFHLGQESREPEDLISGLRTIFGFGSRVIENVVVEELCCKLEIGHLKRKRYRFEDCVREVRIKYEELKGKGGKAIMSYELRGKKRKYSFQSLSNSSDT